jgi:hypothetical protein
LTIQNIGITGFVNGIQITAPVGTGWCNGNNFVNITVNGSQYGYVINRAGGNGTDGNQFIGCQYEYGGSSINAVVNSGYWNYIELFIWDYASGTVIVDTGSSNYYVTDAVPLSSLSYTNPNTTFTDRSIQYTTMPAVCTYDQGDQSVNQTGNLITVLTGGIVHCKYSAASNLDGITSSAAVALGTIIILVANTSSFNITVRNSFNNIYLNTAAGNMVLTAGSDNTLVLMKLAANKWVELYRSVNS